MYPGIGQSALKELLQSPMHEWTPQIPRTTGITFSFTKANGHKLVPGWQPFDGGSSTNPFTVYSTMAASSLYQIEVGDWMNVQFGGTQSCGNISGPSGILATSGGVNGPPYAWIAEDWWPGGTVVDGTHFTVPMGGGNVDLTLSGLVTPSLSLAQAASAAVTMSPAAGQGQWWDVFIDEAANFYPSGGGVFGMQSSGLLDPTQSYAQSYFSKSGALPWWSGAPVVPGSWISGGSEFFYRLLPVPGTSATVTSQEFLYAGWWNDGVNTLKAGAGAPYPANLVNTQTVWQPSQDCFFWYGEVLFDASGNPAALVPLTGKWVYFTLAGYAKPTKWYTIPSPRLLPAGPTAYWPYTADIVYLFINCLPRDYVAANLGWGAIPLVSAL